MNKTRRGEDAEFSRRSLRVLFGGWLPNSAKHHHFSSERLNTSGQDAQETAGESAGMGLNLGIL
jgi:hypothetical protein